MTFFTEARSKDLALSSVAVLVPDCSVVLLLQAMNKEVIEKNYKNC
jgi:hypothetical protein